MSIFDFFADGSGRFRLCANFFREDVMRKERQKRFVGFVVGSDETTKIVQPDGIALPYRPVDIMTFGLGGLRPGQVVTFEPKRIKGGDLAAGRLIRQPLREIPYWKEAARRIMSGNGASGFVRADVVLWNQERGYGFAEADDGRTYFFHVTSVIRRCASDRPGFMRFEGVFLRPSATDSGSGGKRPKAAEVISLEAEKFAFVEKAT